MLLSRQPDKCQFTNASQATSARKVAAERTRGRGRPRSWRNDHGLTVLNYQGMPFYSFTFILILACAYFFYVAGRFEGGSGVTWAGLSILVSVIIWHWLRGDFPLVLLGQVGLYVGITIYRARKKQ